MYEHDLRELKRIGEELEQLAERYDDDSEEYNDIARLITVTSLTVHKYEL